MESKFIKRYISQKVVGYSSDFKEMYLFCEVEYSDGSFGTVTETR